MPWVTLDGTEGASACLTSCDEEPKCRYWTAKILDGETFQCALMSTKGELQEAKGYISGERSCKKIEDAETPSPDVEGMCEGNGVCTVLYCNVMCLSIL